MAAVVVVVGANTFRVHVLPETRYAARAIVGEGDSRFTLTPLSGWVARGDDVLSEDPYINVSIHKRPVVLDQFMYLRFIQHHPSWLRAFAERTRAGRYKRIVTTVPVQFFFGYGHFGAPVNAAIEASYGLAALVGQYYGHYFVYVPTRRLLSCKPRFGKESVRFCGPASARVSVFPGVTFRNGSCARTVANGRPVLSLNLGQRSTKPTSTDTNHGLPHLSLLVTGPFAHPLTSGVIAYRHSKRWVGGIVSIAGTPKRGTFVLRGIYGSHGVARGTFSCG